MLIIFLFLYFNSVAQDEISLFNSKGKPVAYIDTKDDDLTIYLWDGRPVAYLSKDNSDFHIYGFNGKHLGWFINGIVRDHDGNTVGVTKEAASMYTEYEPYKSYKRYKPYKSYKEYAPYKPYSNRTWSSLDFKLFLLLGVNDD